MGSLARNVILTVKYFNVGPGYGKLKNDQYPDVFVHRTYIEDCGGQRTTDGQKLLVPGQQVRCDLIPNPKKPHAMMAINVNLCRIETQVIETDLRGEVDSYSPERQSGILDSRHYGRLVFEAHDFRGPAHQLLDNPVVAFDLVRRQGEKIAVNLIPVSGAGRPSDSPTPAIERGLLGNVVRIKHTFGFIKSGSKDVFFHLSDVKGGVTMRVGQIVRFDIVTGSKGPGSFAGVNIVVESEGGVRRPASRAGSTSSHVRKAGPKPKPRAKPKADPAGKPVPAAEFKELALVDDQPTEEEKRRENEEKTRRLLEEQRLAIANRTLKGLTEAKPLKSAGETSLDEMPSRSRAAQPVQAKAGPIVEAPVFLRDTQGLMPERQRVLSNPLSGPVDPPTRPVSQGFPSSVARDKVPRNVASYLADRPEVDNLRHNPLLDLAAIRPSMPKAVRSVRDPDVQVERPSRDRNPRNFQRIGSESDSDSDEAHPIHYMYRDPPRISPPPPRYPPPPPPPPRPTQPSYVSRGDPTRPNEARECRICGKIVTWPLKGPCGHAFCRKCLESWLKYQPTCPLSSCQKDLSLNVLEPAI